jgi:hypothetical protein
MTSFKRLEIGAKFSHKGSNYRKCDSKRAFKLKESGRGETHARIPISRSATVLEVP